jgi:hypothetical protein
MTWAWQEGVDPDQIAQRQAWIAELDAGRNPFDAATLRALRGEK